MSSLNQKNLREKMSQLITGRNPFSLPSLRKIVLNYRVPEARESQESMDSAAEELTAVSGQKPRLCRSKKSISSFKLRVGEPLALKVTLRSTKMYDFIDKLVNLVFPRLRDFRGMPLDGFDQDGNYNLTIRDQTYFPEIDLDKVGKIRSLQITINISASSKNEAKMLLSALGFPFEKA